MTYNLAGILATQNRPCQDPSHVKEPNPYRPGRMRCKTCKLAADCRSANGRHHRYRAMVFDHYGNACACCGEDIAVFLTIDHVGENGSAHRLELSGGVSRRGGSQTTYRWLIKNGFPPGFQTLCFNCNYAKHRLGSCPHEEVGV